MTQVQTAAPSQAVETPEDTVRKFALYVGERDLEKLVSLYEPDGVFSPEPNVVVKGHGREGARRLARGISGFLQSRSRV